MFFKTHKSGSTTLQNIFIRYADTHNLLLVLPEKGNYFGHPEPFRPDMVTKLQPGYHYNILTHHHRYNYDAIKAVLPEDVILTTVLREPAAAFESLYSFYILRAHFGMSLEKYVKCNESKLNHHNKRVHFDRFGRNQFAFDLGINISQFENENEIRKAIERFEDQFDLVMITERMDESLVLLKHLLCWSTDDVVALHQNARAASAKKKLTSELKRDILKWNRADEMIYDHFYKRFEEKVDEFGKERMKSEVEELRQRTKLWTDYCIGSGNSTSQYVNGFIVMFKGNEELGTNKTCENLIKAEVNYTQTMQIKQRDYWDI